MPSIKLATNSEGCERVRDDMDLNCGTIIDAGESVEACGQRIFDLILAVASGQRTCSEELGYGDNEFTSWQLGAVYRASPKQGTRFFQADYPIIV